MIPRTGISCRKAMVPSGCLWSTGEVDGVCSFDWCSWHRNSLKDGITWLGGMCATVAPANGTYLMHACHSAATKQATRVIYDTLCAS